MPETIMGRDASGVVHEVTPLAPAAGTPAALTWRDRLAAVAHAANHAAARLYHSVLTAEQDVREWHDDNPAMAVFMDSGLAMAKGALTAAGFPVGQVAVLWGDIEAALKTMAAADNSVIGATAHLAVPGSAPTGDST